MFGYFIKFRLNTSLHHEKNINYNSILVLAVLRSLSIATEIKSSKTALVQF